MNFVKKLKLFFIYRDILLKNKKTILDFTYQFENDKRVQPKLRIDNVLRVYGVINLPEEVSTYMDGKLVQKHITSYIRSIDNTFNKVGLNELVGLRDLKQIDETHYLIVFGFSQFNTASVASWLIFSSILLLIYLLGFLFFI
jgi:hypothetical protein